MTLVRSLLLGLAVLLAALLPLARRCVLLRERLGGCGLAKGPDSQDSSDLRSVGGFEAVSFVIDTVSDRLASYSQRKRRGCFKNKPVCCNWALAVTETGSVAVVAEEGVSPFKEVFVGDRGAE